MPPGTRRVAGQRDVVCSACGSSEPRLVDVISGASSAGARPTARIPSRWASPCVQVRLARSSLPWLRFLLRCDCGLAADASTSVTVARTEPRARRASIRAPGASAVASVTTCAPASVTIA